MTLVIPYAGGPMTICLYQDHSTGKAHLLPWPWVQDINSKGMSAVCGFYCYGGTWMELDSNRIDARAWKTRLPADDWCPACWLAVREALPLWNLIDDVVAG